MYQNIVSKFHNISFTVVTIICALLPFFFLPSTVAGLGAVKGALLYIGVLLAFSLWVVAQFIEGSFKIPRHRALAFVAVWIALALASALFSNNTALALWGRGFSLDSFATVLTLGLFAFLVATYARDYHKLIKLFLAAFSGSVITLVLQVILYGFGGTPFVAGYLAHVATQGTLVGSWVDFAYFTTITFLLGLLMSEVLIPKGFFKFLSVFATVLSIIILMFLNFKTAWIVAIISALLVFVYKTSVERSIAGIFGKQVEASEEDAAASAPPRFPVMSFVALLVGLFFFLASSSVGASLSRAVGMNFADIRPSFSVTNHVMRATLWHDPAFGVGAGQFSNVWNLYHPATINQTVFWNSAFDSGYSFLQTQVTTNGIFAGLALLAIIVFSLIHGIKLFNAPYPDRFSRFIAVTAFIILIAFTGLLLLTSPGIVLVTFGFMYLGLLIGVSTLVGKTRLVSLNYLRDPRLSFFAILMLVVAAMVGFSSVYFAANRFASVILYNRAIAGADFPTAQRRLERTLALSSNDIFLRSRAALYTSQFTSEASKEGADKTILQSYFTQAEQSARAAVAWDAGSASNWLALSQVYRLIAGSDQSDAATNAKAAADEALKRNPNNPAYVLNQAQLAVATRDMTGALSYISQALALKPDYLDAFVLRAQIRAGQGNSQGAKDEITSYTRIAPFDAQGYLLLGNLDVELKDYQGALDAFSQVKQLAPNNPTGYLSYINTLQLMGRKSDAIKELQAFKTLFPTVEGVDDQIKRIQGSASTTPAATDEKGE